MSRPNPILLSTRVALLVAMCLAGLFVVRTGPVSAQRSPIRLSVSNNKVEPGDSYTLTWMEGASVQASSDFTIEECTDPKFQDAANLVRYTVRAHRKKFENAAAFSHAIRYYRIRTTAWVRGELDNNQTSEEVVSNVVRVTLVGTNAADKPPSFPDDAEPSARKKKKTDTKDDKKDEDAYPTMGRPDLAVVHISTDPSKPRAGSPFNVRVTVRNQGVVPAPSARVKIEIGNSVYFSEVEPLKPRFAVDARFVNLIIPKSGPLTIKAIVDPDDQIPESREDNNALEATFDLLPAEVPASPQPSSPQPDGK